MTKRLDPHGIMKLYYNNSISVDVLFKRVLCFNNLFYTVVFHLVLHIQLHLFYMQHGTIHLNKYAYSGYQGTYPDRIYGVNFCRIWRKYKAFIWVLVAERGRV